GGSTRTATASGSLPPPAAALGPDEPPEECHDEDGRDRRRDEVEDERDVADVGAKGARAGADRRGERGADHDPGKHDRDGDEARGRLEAPPRALAGGEGGRDPG